MIFSDKSLSQKLERAEARANADFVETRARLDPESGAEWIDVGGTYAMFDGVESPCTQTFGLGLFEEVTDVVIERLEMFYRDHDAPVFHEVSPLADPSLMPILNERGYQPIELTSVMYRTLDDSNTSAADPRITSRIITSNEVELWARTSSAGWAIEHESLADFMLGFGRISAQCAGAYPYIAELNGKALATGMMFIYGDIAILAGASTVPDGRNNGAQNALLDARLKFAAEKGCALAALGAMPGSQSQRNAQKNGFNIAYTRTKWRLGLSGDKKSDPDV
ncbi:MAG: hypothetical protein WBD22_11320 [Pyrinomonadaceae bacterium]